MAPWKVWSLTDQGIVSHSDQETKKHFNFQLSVSVSNPSLPVLGETKVV